MTTETNLDPNAVETSGYGAPVETPPPADDTANEPNPETNDELELTDEDELVEGGEGDEAKPEKRHKSAKQRIDELTKARREAERERDELRAQLQGKKEPEPNVDAAKALADLEAKKPVPDDFEFGDADPAYQEALMDWKVDVRLAKRDAEASADEERKVVEARQAEARQTLVNLDEGWAEAEKRGATKYADFADKVEDFKANAPCPPLMAVAIQASPVAEDVTYHLATNQDQAELIAARLSGGDVLGAARQLGEIEGQFLDKKPDRPSANAHAADHALYAGRLKGFLNRKEKPKAKIATDAPDPPKERARGGNGQFSPDWASDDADLGALAKQLR